MAIGIIDGFEAVAVNQGKGARLTLLEKLLNLLLSAAFIVQAC